MKFSIFNIISRTLVRIHKKHFSNLDRKLVLVSDQYCDLYFLLSQGRQHPSMNGSL